MDLPPPATPPAQPGPDMVRLGRYIFVTRGILWRSLTLLVANEPKPWSPRVKTMRKDMAAVHGMLSDAWGLLDDATKSAAIRATDKSSKD